MNNTYGAMILPDGKYYSLDDRMTKLNNNVLVIGTTGAAKTRTVVVPNLLECVGSYIVTDPKGNLYKQWGKYMQEHGYRVLRLSFIHPEKSVHYNPLKYVQTTHQIQQLASSIVSSSDGKSSDPFWDESALILINSIIAYIKESTKEESQGQNICTIMELLRLAGRNENEIETALNMLMTELHEEKPSSWAYKQYRNVSQAPERTFNSIVVSAIAKFSSIDTEEIAKMMAYDEINLKSIGQRKTVVFVEVSDSDRSMDRLVNIFFTQAMNQLCTYADEECEDSMLPVPVRFIMDDFATNCRIDNFENMISNIRSRKISAILILQSLSQLEDGYGRSSHTIVDDCDTLVYMGGNDPETAQAIAIRSNKTIQTILHMPLCSSWIFRRGEKPFMCRNFQLEEYLKNRSKRLENTHNQRESDEKEK